MIKLLPVIFLLSINIFVADNEISIDQTGATANLDIEQLGSGNLIGGSTATAGSMTALDLDGATMTLDINQLEILIYLGRYICRQLYRVL